MLVTGEILPSDTQIDHKNKDATDNKWGNLRKATNAQNNMNKGKRTTPCSSKYKGVYWDKQNNRWRAQIKLDYKNMYIGLFENEKDAYAAYQKKAEELFGEFSGV